MPRSHETEMAQLHHLKSDEVVSPVLVRNLKLTKDAFKEVFGNDSGVHVRTITCPFCKKGYKSPTDCSSANIKKHLIRFHLNSTSDEDKDKLLKLLGKLKKRKKN